MLKNKKYEDHPVRMDEMIITDIVDLTNELKNNDR